MNFDANCKIWTEIGALIVCAFIAADDVSAAEKFTLKIGFSIDKCEKSGNLVTCDRVLSKDPEVIDILIEPGKKAEWWYPTTVDSKEFGFGVRVFQFPRSANPLYIVDGSLGEVQSKDFAHVSMKVESPNHLNQIDFEGHNIYNGSIYYVPRLILAPAKQ